MINITNVRKSKKESNKGITLIALVITIIVLLILATVSIATLTGENGILTKANTAKDLTIEAEEKEQINLAYTTVMADKLHSNSGNGLTVSAEELETQLNNQNAGATAETEEDKIKVTFTKSGNVYTVNGGTGAITGPENSGNQEPVVPEKSELEKAKEEQKTFETKTEIQDTFGNKVVVPEGFKIASDSADLITDGVVIEDTTENHNQFVWVPVDDINNFERIEGYSNNNLQSMLTNCTEPFANGYNTETSEYNAMYESVRINKGFYIGRFEAGNDGSGNVVVKKGANVYNNVPWGNSMSDIEGTTAVKLAKEFASKNGYQGVTSTLCYGVQWDATMQFMDSKYLSGTCEADSYVRNSTNRGHYEASSPTTTGSKAEYAEKNIYDMAGNVLEWTMEAYHTGNRVFRGGLCYDYGSGGPASCRYGDDPGISYDDLGFRLALCL